MSITDLVKNLYDKYRSDIKFNTSLILSEIAAPIGSAALAYFCDYINFGDYTSSIAGGITGHYLSAVATFSASWYLLNKNRYSSKFKEYVKDCTEITIKNLPPAIISYIIYAPIAGLITYLDAKPAVSAFFASVSSAAIFMAGSNVVNQRIIRKN
jgi:hypothetical protein